MVGKGIPARRDTRSRILREGFRLFSKNGFRATTVGEIEEAAGLAPRSGGLYKHFSSKEELLAEIIDRQVAEMDEVVELIHLLPRGDLRAELTLIARWILRDLERRKKLWRLIAAEGSNLPELLERSRSKLVQRGYREAAAWIRHKIQLGELPKQDCEALAACAIGALANYRLTEMLFDEPPLAVGEERFIAAWVKTWLSVARVGP